MNVHRPIDWTSPDAYIVDIRAPARRRSLLALLERLAAAIASQWQTRQSERQRWRQLSRGSPEIPARLRADIGLPPLIDLPSDPLRW